ncbi:unnamed protein product [Lymnaea stagnalis]|uniref:Uncharacterized protein n=1 Tax=Lymnaea stagnalis TaxID=6523 RepID=A0AAV2HMH7_LYMST
MILATRKEVKDVRRFQISRRQLQCQICLLDRTKWRPGGRKPRAPRRRERKTRWRRGGTWSFGLVSDYPDIRRKKNSTKACFDLPSSISGHDLSPTTRLAVVNVIRHRKNGSISVQSRIKTRCQSLHCSHG